MRVRLGKTQVGLNDELDCEQKRKAKAPAAGWSSVGTSCPPLASPGRIYDSFATSSARSLSPP